VKTRLSRIAVVSENLSPPLDEGFKKASVMIAASLAGTGKDITVFTPGPLGPPLAGRELPRNKLLVGSAFSRDLKAADLDAILYIPQAAATPMSLVRAAMLRRQAAGTPVVVLSLQRRAYPAVITPFLRFIRPKLVLVLSGVSRRIMESAGFRARRIPLGVDIATFKPAEPQERETLRHKYGIGNGRFLLHIGHVSLRRNLELLKRISGTEHRLLIVSSTSTRRDPDVAQALKDESIIFIDRYVDAVEEIYRLADGYVFPTFTETGAIEIPLSVLEALATNLPVTTTAFGGIPDLFSEGNGLFICSSEAEFIRKSRDMLTVESVSTRDTVSGLTWDDAAGAIIEAMESEIA
jgi:glycosyltransferase involved in cell wall biosynthesis